MYSGVRGGSIRTRRLPARAGGPPSDRFRAIQASSSAYRSYSHWQVHANDRQGLERLCRYLSRPPFALERLSELPDERLAYRMKRPRGGSLWLVLTPDELIAKLATLVPPPGTHGTRYHGLFAPNAKGRARVVPEPVVAAQAPAATPQPQPPAGGPPARAVNPARSTEKRAEAAPPPRYRIRWAELLRKVFGVDVFECPALADPAGA